jgi:hypothetical protein
MVKSAFSILAVGAVAGIALAPAAASAGTDRPAALAYSSTQSGGDPNTTVTFTVTVGALSMTAPATADLGSGAPDTTITGALGTVAVTDDRALLGATWTATASATDWTTGGGTAAETIPATDVGYAPGAITTTPATGLATGTAITLAGTPAPVVTLATNGDNTAAWDPAIAVAVPVTATGGVYTSTLTQSVS